VRVAGTPDAPLREFLRASAERVATAWEAARLPGAAAPDRQAVRRFLDLLEDLERAAAEAADPGRAEPQVRADVLLLASNASLAASVRQLLAREHRVEIATAADAFRRAATRHADVVVACDAGALEAVRAMRELAPGLPAIVAARSADAPAIAATFDDDPVVVVRDPASADELALSIRAVLQVAADHLQDRDERRAPKRSMELPDARSYAHLAGLLPRALDRTVEFDVGAAVIARAAGEPIVDVHATRDVAEETLETVRERALSTFQVVAGGAKSDDSPAGPEPFPLRSTLHVPIATEGRLVGIVFVGAFEANAFSEEDQRALDALATHASGAYRRLEASLRRLRLTPRQSQIVALIASGLSDKQVAARLGLAHRTVRTHLDRLLREHGLHSRTEVVAAWLRNQQA
jgi:DNA-binding NarL/FixJ family response regulator